MFDNLETREWWSYLDTDLQQLLVESVLLLREANSWKEIFDDYSFVIFPAAKSYEGFLKKVFLDMGFITGADYQGTHFRVGRALNPDFHDQESVYFKLRDFCHNETLPDRLWQTWKQCRNLIFHYFPNEKHTLTIEEARSRLMMILDSIEAVFVECELNK